MKKRYKLFQNAAFVLTLGIVLFSCQKMERAALGNYPKDANPPGGPLKFYAAFDGTSTDPLLNAVDSVRANFAASNPLASVAGISGKAVQGLDGKAIKYLSANDWKNSTSISIAIWIKKPAQAATQFLFALQDDTPPFDGWSHSSMFLLLENQTATKATMKLYFFDQWLEFAGANELQKPIFDGNWHHLVFVYDQTTSKMSYYVDGALVTNAPAGATDVKKNGNPRGALDLRNASAFVLGGWNKHASLPGPTDGWASSFSGAMDQLRLYGKALSASEVLALYNSKL